MFSTEKQDEICVKESQYHTFGGGKHQSKEILTTQYLLEMINTRRNFNYQMKQICYGKLGFLSFDD